MLTSQERKYMNKNLGRKPTRLELEMASAEWSEHCSYKSSKNLLRLLPTRGKRVLIGPGYDAGVLDIGNGKIITVHIESHNHPSAIDPYGGAATGVGGVIRDIISMGTKPIALLNSLRFGPIEAYDHSSKAKWLFKNVVKGIADYGNCLGIPTVGGEIEFDHSFDQYCLVDVAAIGYGRKEDVISNTANVGDLIVLAGNRTGRDGIRGASFASKLLRNDRSAVQIPDPFLEKLLIDAILEATKSGYINAIKDLGGGGLACCLSELSDSLGLGFEIELSSVHKKVSSMTPEEIMTSESQERMVFVISKEKFTDFAEIFGRFCIPYSIVGEVKNNKYLSIFYNGKCIAKIRSSLLANAPLAHRRAIKPLYLRNRKKRYVGPPMIENYGQTILQLLSNHNIGSKRWVYRQYDHEVGLRSVIKPGEADAAVLRIDNDKFISVKLDGNPKYCYLDPYQGTLGCLSEACRNVRCTGADPIGIIDHLQFGNPENPGIYWTFKKSIEAIRRFCTFFSIPVIGGKVSFYNETEVGTIKPTPVIGAIGLIEGRSKLVKQQLNPRDSIFIVGPTNEEMGGSEYFENYPHNMGGRVPKVHLGRDQIHGDVILKLIESKVTNCVHDCSKGGLAVSLVELALNSDIGISVELERIPNNCSRLDYLLFSESHSRYLFATKNPDQAADILRIQSCIYAKIGYATGYNSQIQLKSGGKVISEIPLNDARRSYENLNIVMAGSDER